jgi:ATP-dependent DNA helicase RecG
LRTRLDSLTEGIQELEDLSDNLYEAIKKRFNLWDLTISLRKIHFPDNKNDIIESRKRLAFDELLDIYFKLLQEREKRISSISPVVTVDNKKIDNFIQGLPFQLTKSQTLAITDIYNDYKKSYPMHRLLQGDVGSGKTIVALIASLPVINSGYQTIILTPTSVLAQQHYLTITKFLNGKHKVILQTATSKNSKKEIETSDIIISTHSILFQEKELLNRLGLVIIDEEHRFGVEQRKQLIEYSLAFSKRPHLLNLTATPIPRSVALSLFGQMDVSIIEKPEGRLPVKTFVVPLSKKIDSITWLKEKLGEGGQIFWVCPLIDESEEEDPMMSVAKLYSEVKDLFKEFNVEFLHGKIKNKEKDRVLNDFKSNKIQILISTTVIEVGIDIPNANIMIIENAEMFGLAQLHQLRGRVGRNNQEAWCLLYTKLENQTNVMSRLSYFAGEKNGIKIAEYDLGSRGPGEVYGTIQAGLPNLKVANFSNIELMNMTREAAEIIYKSKSI